VAALARVRGALVLAVSGGLDSMTLLHIAASHPRIRKRCVVATFDHGTGRHATRAVRLVRATARQLGVPVVSARAARLGSSEAEWRDMRWEFLRSVARKHDATVVTAHTRDDQIETVVMRVLRGCSARGLAALYAPSPVARPLLNVRRRSLEQYARRHSLTFVDDPTNADRRYLRNRVRQDLLPALRAVQPRFESEMIGLARAAARLRRRIEGVAAGLSRQHGDALEIEVAALARLEPRSIALLWPAFVARLGVALDRRGIERATGFVLASRTGHRAQCAGGIRLRRTRGTIVITCEGPDDTPRSDSAPHEAALAVDTAARGAWKLLGSPATYFHGGQHVA
jgi:tRNA(Ile)-lysidine synthase